MKELNNHYTCNKVRKIKVIYGEWEEGDYEAQQSSNPYHPELLFPDYRGQKILFVPAGCGIGRITNGRPYWTGNRWAEWTTVKIHEPKEIKTLSQKRLRSRG